MTNDKTMQDLEAENAQLKGLLLSLNERCSMLEEECNDLAMANEYLQKNLNDQLKISQSIKSESMANSYSIEKDVDIFVDGSGKFVHSKKKILEKLCGGKNPISCAFMYDEDGDIGDLVLVGGVDATLTGYDMTTSLSVLTVTMDAHILMIECFRSFIACALMDGGVVIVSSTNLLQC